MAGVISGAATATKITALSFLVLPFLAWAFGGRKLTWFLSFLLVGFLVFMFVSPYTFLDWKKFAGSMNYEAGVATGRLKVVYVLQFEKTIPYLFQLKNFFWQTGPGALFGILGILYVLFRGMENKLPLARRLGVFVSFARYPFVFSFASSPSTEARGFRELENKNRLWLLVFAFPLFYFLYVGSWYIKFIRFMVPILPFLILAAAFLLWEIRRKWRFFGNTLITLVVLVTALWSLAFFSIYTREQTRITASRWIYHNIPQGAVILREHWDDWLPIDLKPLTHTQYQLGELTIYEPDNKEKIEYYAEKLSGADYIIINSRRLYGTLMYLPEKYPITSHYYKLLFSGQLGYRKIAEFSSYPKIFGFEVNDDSSEETFQVYDHPKVIIFANQARFSTEELLLIL